MRWVVMALAVALAGCSTADKIAMTRFEPLTDQEFKYDVQADWVHPSDSTAAEQERLAWLSQYLKDNRLCPDGYAITDRRVILVGSDPLADLHRIYYSGRCKTAS